MSAPTTDIHWSTSLINATEPDSTHKDDGWTTDEIPTSANVNWLLWAITQWVIWLKTQALAPLTTQRQIVPYFSSASTMTIGGDADGFRFNGTTGSASATVSLDVPVGYGFTSVTVAALCDNSSGMALGLTLFKVHADGSSNTILWTTPTVLGTPQDDANNVASDHEVAIPDVSLTGLTVTTAAVGLVTTYSRSTGDYIADGFVIGQAVTWSGFVNPSNNITGCIQALTSSDMTIYNTGANETKVGASVASLTADGDAAYSLNLTIEAESSGANWMRIYNMRTVMPQPGTL